MELMNLINQMGTNNVEFDEKEVKIINILNENKYELLAKYLQDKNIKTTNDLKKLSLSDYNKLKMEIPRLPGVGQEKVALFIKKMNYIRMRKNDINNHSLLDKSKTQNNLYIQNVGKIKSSKKAFIELNFIKYENGNEYFEIRKVKNNGTRCEGISIKKELLSDFISIVQNIECLDMISYNDIKKEEMPNNSKKTLKEMILDNEKQLSDKFYSEYGQAINLFIQKIKSLPTDGDIVKFLNNKFE